jgi:hypothetical protein
MPCVWCHSLRRRQRTIYFLNTTHEVIAQATVRRPTAGLSNNNFRFFVIAPKALHRSQLTNIRTLISVEQKQGIPPVTR